MEGAEAHLKGEGQKKIRRFLDACNPLKHEALEKGGKRSV